MRLVWFFLMMLFVGACVDRFVLKPGQNPHMIVISGSITDQPGPYTVKIYTNQPVDRTTLPQSITRAIVTISEDGGISETLKETSEGVYQTHLLQGQVGKSYVLNVMTREGESYTSTTEKILPVGNISNVTAEFIKVVDPDYDYGLSTVENGFNLYADAWFDPGQESRAIWSWAGTFKYETDPKDHFYTIGSHRIVVLDPVPCSGYVNARGTLKQVGACTCCICFHTQHNLQPDISNADEIVDNVIRHQWLGFIPMNPRFFTEKMIVVVQQASASAVVHRFWASVKSNGSKGSDLFQTPPVTTTGNIKADDPTSLPALGLFAAYAIKTDTIILRDKMVPYTFDPAAELYNACQDVFLKETSTVRPSFYFVEP